MRLIRVEEHDSVSSVARLPQEELAAHGELEGTGNGEGPALAEAAGVARGTAGDGHPPHLLNDGVGEAEARDHIDDRDADGEPDVDA